MTRPAIIALAASILSVSLTAKDFTVTSPDGSIRTDVSVEDEVSFTVSYGSDTLFRSSGISMILRDKTLGLAPEVKSARNGSFDRTSDCPFPISDARIRNNYNSLTLGMRAGRETGRIIAGRLHRRTLAYARIQDIV